MDLTPANKAHIDRLPYHVLLAKWRHTPSGDPWFEGDTGAYWLQRMSSLRDQDQGAAVRASKDIGWDR
jgi:hypothetical protein